MSPPDSVVLAPYVNPYDSARRRSRYADSRLELRDGRLVWTPSSSKRDRAWPVQVGAAPGQAMKIIRVFGTIARGPRGTSTYIDKFAVVDVSGALVGGFPYGVGNPRTAGVPYPHGNVEAFARKAGLAFEQQEVESPEELMASFPGLVQGAAVVKWSRYALSLTYLIGGVAFMWIALSGPPRAGAAGIVQVVSTGMVVVGGLFVLSGALCFPPAMDRIRARMKIKHPERFQPPSA